MSPSGQHHFGPIREHNAVPFVPNVPGIPPFQQMSSPETVGGLVWGTAAQPVPGEHIPHQARSESPWTMTAK
ncbi:hypothetical protein HYALB_00013331 [Hymenoscyphus albidus]|uniref:Uncharacterized protein n=1 Tax=Hymenoscyphus albidus TaxID=595503 RepID=A0A9N9LTP2_9HELO|nr:hypothetical protein HYALB_00013331 [Hymenoscyphus albidus]